LIDPDNGVSFLKQKGYIFASSTGGVKDAFICGNKTQELLEELLVRNVAIDAAYLVVERGLAIILLLAIASHVS
jgi:hypothetical protein